jgi:hypothetical protein
LENNTTRFTKFKIRKVIEKFSKAGSRAGFVKTFLRRLHGWGYCKTAHRRERKISAFSPGTDRQDGVHLGSEMRCLPSLHPRNLRSSFAMFPKLVKFQKTCFTLYLRIMI